MRLSDFDYRLPEDRIAQTPVEPRDHSRLLVLHRKSGEREHRRFHDLPRFLRPGDALVLNDTRVIPARLLGSKAETGGQVEVLLLRRLAGDTWEGLVRPAKRVKEGTRIRFGDGRLSAVALEEAPFEGGRRFLLQYSGVFEQVLDELGQMPLPPYIKAALRDPSQYQTVYARHPGSAAAPTAGLHFTPRLLAELSGMGVRLYYVTLHVGLGTFRPVQVEHIEDHRMHAEFYDVPPAAADGLNSVRAAGGRWVVVGTTCVRTLETLTGQDGRLSPGQGWTDLFIYPGHRFRAVDAMVTNFHLPRSSLLMLVSALAGRELILETYAEAVEMGYRFFSFGDAMLIL